MSQTPRRPIPPKRAENLYCDEKLEPPHEGDPFEESAPGIYHLNSIQVCQPKGKPTTFRTDLEPEDVKLVNELGRLTPDQLMEYIRHLQSDAFALGIEESKQFRKAKVLQIFKAKDV